MTTNSKYKVAIIGCGAITEEMYLPAAGIIPNLTVTHIVDLNEEPIALRPYNAEPRKSIEEFALQLSNFANAITKRSTNYVAAAEVLPTISMIEQCHRSRKLTVQPWEAKHLESFFEAKHNDK